MANETNTGTTEETTASGTETPEEKKTRIGGRVRAFSQVNEALDKLIAAETAKDQDAEVSQSVIVETLTALKGSFDALLNPPKGLPRSGVAKVLKPYFVGWLTDGKRLAFTMKPENMEFVQENGRDKIQGPYSTRTLAMMIVDLGYIPAAAPAPAADAQV